MNRILKYVGIGIISILSKTTKAQSFGGTAQFGMYSANYTNPMSQKEQLKGKGYLGLGATYEHKIGASGQMSIPMVVSYSRFGTEQVLGENNIMTQNANALNIGAGVKYFLNSEANIVRPFLASLVSYEALLASTYYYDANQAGNLEWKSNAQLNIQAGVGFDTGLNSRVDFFGTLNLGLFNRLDKDVYGTYKDRVLGLGVNFVFN